jgi:hypothetical protein
MDTPPVANVTQRPLVQQTQRDPSARRRFDEAFANAGGESAPQRHRSPPPALQNERSAGRRGEESAGAGRIDLVV